MSNMSSLTSMTRKLLALAIVLTISGLAPATAVIGSCAKMPCCFGEAGQGPVVGPDMSDCCTTINCYEAPSQELTVSATSKNLAATTAAVVPVVAPTINIQLARRTFDDTSPPPSTRQRLSSLSTLLI